MPAARPPRRTEYMPLDDVLRAPRNPKMHDDKLISASFKRFGVVELPALDERTGRLVAGHGRLNEWERSRAEGDDPPDGVITDTEGGWLVPVNRGWSSRSDADAEAYLIVSNQATIAGGWDDEALLEVLQDLRDEGVLAFSGFGEDDIAALGGTSSPGERNPLGDDDNDPEPPADPITQPGDVWHLGRHRLVCGSALDPDALGSALQGDPPGIIYTDPPYGVKAVPADGGRSRSKLAQAGFATGFDGHVTAYREIVGDDTTATAVAAFTLAHGTWPKARHVWWGANHYAADAALPNATCWLVWNKANGASDFADCEIAWSNHPGAVRMFTHMWNGMLRASERGPRVHPTQKPVALAEWAINLMADDAPELVLDPFGGSGSTLLACELTGHSAAILELDPGYCDVICRRYEQATGDTPIRDDRPVSFLDGDLDE